MVILSIRISALRLSKSIDEGPVLLRSVYPLMGAVMDADGYPVPMLEDSELLELFELLRWSRLQSGIDGQELPSIHVEADMPEGMTVSRIVAIEGNACTREVHRTVGPIDDDFHDIGIKGIIRWGHGGGDGSHLAIRSCLQGTDPGLDGRWVHLWLVGLDIHHEVAIHRLDDLGDSACAIGVMRGCSAALEAVCASRLEN